MKAFNRFLPKINRYFVTFWDISTFKRTFYSILDAECSAHYMQGRDKHSSRNSQPFPRYGRKLIDISVSLEIFRRLNAHFTPFYTPIAVDAVFSLEISPAA